jgi:hypothetical protein
LKEAFVKKTAFLNYLPSLLLGYSLLMFPCNIYGEASTEAIDACSKEQLLSYFPPEFVNSSLSRFNIPQDKWEGIDKSLAAQDKEAFIRLVEEKALKVDPNLLTDPQKRLAAVKLFRETLLEVFTKAMKENGITDESQFQAILDDIQQQKARRFAECMQKRREQIQQSESMSSKTNDSKSYEDSDALQQDQ